MEIRKLPISQGLAWFKQSIDLGGQNPRGVFGAAALMLVLAYALAVAIVMVMVLSAGTLPGGEGEEPDVGALMGALWPWIVLMMLVLSVLMTFLVGGVMHVIRETEAGNKPGALAVFQPFRSGRAGSLVLVALLVLLIQVVGGVLVMMAGGSDYLDAYVGMVRAIMSGADPLTVPQPQTNLLMFVLQLLVNYIAYAVLLFAVPSVLFLGAGLGEALGASLRASFRNVGANLLAALLLILALLIGSLLFMLVLALVAMVAMAVHEWLGTMVILVLGLAFVSALVVVMVGAAYLAWRDTFEGAAPAAGTTDTPAGFEA